MARPKKCRRVCGLPQTTEFVPRCARALSPIAMTVDEYETIRLIDHEGLTQEDAAVRMNVARTTVQAIYVGARKKLAAALVDGRPLSIGGGDFEVCDGAAGRCRGRGCPHRGRGADGPVGSRG